MVCRTLKEKFCRERRTILEATKDFKDEIILSERGIREILPQIPYVLDQVGAAMDWVREVQDEGTYLKTLKFALDVANFAAKISEPKFFKTYLVVAALLMDIDNVETCEKFNVFKTASHSVENALNKLRINPESSAKRGCFKAVTVHLAQVARESQELFTVLAYSILNELKDIVAGMEEAKEKSPITAADYIRVLGYAYVMANLRMAQLEYSDHTRKVINEIEILLNSKVNY